MVRELNEIILIVIDKIDQQKIIEELSYGF